MWIQRRRLVGTNSKATMKMNNQMFAMVIHSYRFIIIIIIVCLTTAYSVNVPDGHCAFGIQNAAARLNWLQIRTS